MNRLFFSLLAALFLETGVQSGAADIPALAPFPDNTRYAAVGDSITQNGWYEPYVDLYYLTRFPRQKLDVFNCGINGDTADGGIKRYSWDIAPLLDAYLRKMRGSPWEKAIEGEVGAYKKCKQDEPAMRAKIDSMLQDIRVLAQPVPHVVKISPAPANPLPAQ